MSRSSDVSGEGLELARRTIRSVRGIPSLPETARRAGQVADDPESSLDELAAAFAADSALCSHLLKVANSAFFGLRAEVSSISHAAALLGRKTLRNVAMAASMQALLPRVRVHPSFSPAALWRHSIRTAASASLLAEILELASPEEAFAAGLIHDLGLLVEIEVDRAALGMTVDAWLGAGSELDPARALAMEREAFGADHQHFGHALCESWGFPKKLVEAAAHHHDPLQLAAAECALAALVNMAEACGVGFEHGLANGPRQLLPQADILEFCGCGPEQLDALRERLELHADQAEAAFSVASSVA